ncbi:MAG: DNA polymerase III subunit alpha [Chloroflexi bacterium]|nr:DNA polymerase III subunit alpha [Chloroflexota bacterium]
MQASPRSDFVHLHVHSEFSLLDGMGKIPQLVSAAREQGMRALALTDHGSMYGAMNFYLEARRQGIQPIVGCEVYVAARAMDKKEGRRDQSSTHLTLLAENEVGYRNLIGMVSRAHLEGFYYRPRIDLDLLAAHSDGIVCLSGCPSSEVSRRIRQGNTDSALELAGFYRELFGADRFFVEVMNHGLDFERQLNVGLLEISKRLQAPLVGTQDVHYVGREDRDAHDALLCIGTKSRVADADRLRMEGHYHLAGPEEMAGVLAEFPDAFENTNLVAERCHLELDLGRISLPQVDLPEGRTAAEHLRALAVEGLNERRRGSSPGYRERLDYELGIICDLGFEVYFLIHAEIFQFVRQRGMLAGPRGSVGGSLVAFALGISGIDPIERNIPFERFLNEGRRDRPPDIDMDFPDNERATVIEYLARKYGRDHVAQIATFGTMAARQVVRDVGRVLEMPYDAVDRIAKAIPQNAVDPWDLRRALDNVDEIASAYAGDPQVKRLIDLGLKLEGISRNPSVHAAGVVVSSSPLAEHLPLMRGQQGERVAQYTFETLETIGFLKLDILGLTTFRTLSTALGLIKTHHGRQIDIEKIPFDDSATFEMLSRGRTVGCFQLEGEGMTRALVQLKPTRVEDLAVLVALYRPGPMSNIDQYVAMKNAPERVSYLHPSLRPILEETYGVMVYQDQVLIAARELAGYSWPEIDVMRKALGKKIPAELAEQREKFLTGAAEREIPRQVAESIYELIEPFGGYGFNKAHAFYYGTVAYWTAYLKANYPREFMAAVLTTAAGDSAKLAAAIGECRKLGIKVEPPSVARSGADFEVDGPSIRFGLASIKGIGRQAAQSIVEKRGSGYTDMPDMCKRASDQIGRLQLEKLAKAGALDVFGERNALLGVIDPVIRHLQSLKSSGLLDQQSLFGAMQNGPGNGEAGISFALPSVEPASPEECAGWERELLGINFTSDAMDEVIERLRAGRLKLPDQIDAGETGSKVATGGVVSQLRSFRTRNNNQMCAFQLVAGGSGGLAVTVLPRMYEKSRRHLEENTRLWLTGRVESDGPGVRLLIGDEDTVAPLAQLPADGPPPDRSARRSGSRRRRAPAHPEPRPGPQPPSELPDRALRLRMRLCGDEDADRGALAGLAACLRGNPGRNRVELELTGQGPRVLLAVPDPVGDPAGFLQDLPEAVELLPGGSPRT